MSVRSLNKVQLIGNLTRDPEMRYTTNGTPVVTFGMATNKSWKDKEGNVKETAEFHNIVAWNKIAEICQQLLAKGMKVYIEGSLTTRSWESDEGSTRYKTEVRVDDMILLDSKGREGAGIDQSEASQEDEVEEESTEVEEDESNEDPLEDSDLPF